MKRLMKFVEFGDSRLTKLVDNTGTMVLDIIIAINNSKNIWYGYLQTWLGGVAGVGVGSGNDNDEDDCVDLDLQEMLF